MNKNKPTMLNAALACAGGKLFPQQPCPVFPCDPRTKAPLTEHGFKDATAEEAVVRERWTQHHDAMIGVPTGAASGMFVVDLDLKPGGGDGPATWEAWEGEHGAVATRRHHTPSGGQHLLFRFVPGIRSVALDRLGPGIEIKGEGGYVVVPDSVMADGRRYTSSGADAPADAPPWLLHMLQEYYRRRDEAWKLDPPTGQQQVDVEQVRAALAVIPSESYQTWFEVGGALHRALGKEAGYPLFEEWSKKSKKFRQSECREKWTNGLASITEFGLGTVFWHANEADPEWRDRFRQAQTKVSIQATPYVWVDPSRLPRREWLYKPSYIRKFSSMLVAHSKGGKSSLMTGEALAMVGYKPLLGVMPSAGPLRVWYWNGEDPIDEVDRRVAAAIKHYGLQPEDIGNRFFRDSGRQMPIVIAEAGLRGTTKIAIPVVEGVVQALLADNIDVLIIDPFVSCHQVPENDNGAIDRVAKQWAAVAERANCAIRYAHHSRKTGGEEVTGESQRGASANYAAVRNVSTLNAMTEEQAASVGIEVKHRTYYFRQVDESNLLPPTEDTRWYERVSVDLLNGTWAEESDRVGVTVPWVFPVITDIKPTDSQEQHVMDTLRKQDWWRENPQSPDWVGMPVARVLDINVKRGAAGKLGRKRVSEYLAKLLDRGLLRKQKRKLGGKVDVPCITARDRELPLDGE